MTLPYPSNSTLYSPVIIDNYYGKVIRLNKVFNDKENAINYGKAALQRNGFLNQDQTYHIDDIHVYVEEIKFKHGNSPHAQIEPSSEIFQFQRQELDVQTRT
jgi:hypothetical protein